MTLLDGIDWESNLTVNFMWENKFFEPWTKVGAFWFGNYEKIKIKKKTKKMKTIKYDGF